ncbi:MAG: tetraacyldisaccharide 4'-kinase [Bacteroidetes bacterium]|nr:tetraacyldisaccharide 4'-kinase [Bacteroidota bacterium]
MRALLIPFAIIYHLITALRNWLYDVRLWKSKSYDFPVIGVGNLKTGGTGKTPMAIYLLNHLKGRDLAMLSRGYGRRTSGFRLVSLTDAAKDVGDEPALIKTAVPSTLVAVDENRVHGVTSILKMDTTINTLILDDVFQHRAVNPGHMILLTVYDDLYVNDLVLPAGSLRESSRGASRANTIVVTKCPKDLSQQQRNDVINKLSTQAHQEVFFAFEEHGKLRRVGQSDDVVDLSSADNILLVTGIAKTDSILKHLHGQKIEHLKFRDHHAFTVQNVKSMKAQFEQLPSGNNLIVTTQKDAQRLQSLLQNENFAKLPIYAIEHQMELLSTDREAFQLRIDEYINSH